MRAGAVAHTVAQGRRAGRAVLDFLYPPTCPICQRALDRDDEVICVHCRVALAREPDWRCALCGAGGFGRAPEPGKSCRLCPPAGASWRGALGVTPYCELSARCVHLFKYNHRGELGEVMAGLMVRRLAEPLAGLGHRLNVVAPVPLHWRRSLARGFNQSELLARTLAGALGVACDERLLRRVRYTPRQALVPHTARAANVADAFALRRGRAVRDRGVLLIDDVVTTGETINECAKVLMQAGAREVWVACFARVGMGRPEETE